MFGISSRFSNLEIPAFDFPKTLHYPTCELRNERQFIEFLIRNDWVQRMVGIKMQPSNGLFPDIHGEIYDGSGDKIRVEAEYHAENYKLHRHPFGGCNLILSFIRNENSRVIRGVPVWSFYKKYEGDHVVDLCLHDDIKTDFDKLNTQDKKILGKCIKCNTNLYYKYQTICAECSSASTSIRVSF